MLAERLLGLQIIACLLIRLGNSDEVRNLTDHSVQSRSIILELGYFHYPNLRTSYKIHSNLATWANARQACINEGGRLAVIDNVQKIQSLRSQRTTRAKIWIGIYRETYAGPWTAVDNSEMPVLQPWVLSNHTGPTSNCVAMGAGSPGLRAYPCNLGRMYACEIPDAV